MPLDLCLVIGESQFGHVPGQRQQVGSWNVQTSLDLVSPAEANAQHFFSPVRLDWNAASSHL